MAIEPGTEVQNAYIQFQADETDSIATSLTIQGETTDNASTFVSANGNITTRPLTTAAVAWIPNPWTKSDAGLDQRTPDITSIIQEIVDQPGWASGNSLVIMISGTGERTAESFEGNQAAAPMLHVDLGVAQLSITPMTASVAPGGGASFTASGGDGSYTFSLFANNSGGSIDPSTGAYTAGPTGGVSDTVRVTDGLSATADATVTVTAALSITPTTASVVTGGGASFTASGGDGSYTFSLFANNSGGSIDPSTGSYTAGPTGGVSDTVRVTDGLGATADATVTVTVINVVVTTPSGSNGYSTQGGQAGNKHLLVTITVENEVGIPIEGALVTATISGPQSS